MGEIGYKFYKNGFYAYEQRWHNSFFFSLPENRQLLGELSGIDTLLQCLSVSSLAEN